MRCSIIIPTYNGGSVWEECASALKKYTPESCKIYVVDSQSSDNTVAVAEKNGFIVEVIDKNDFNHGGTRNKAANSICHENEVILFLTQDAIPESNFVPEILKLFSDEQVACAYGRQLPHINASPLATHARLFNYPDKGHCYSLKDASKAGIKTVFTSNSFSAYRGSVFKEIGGFPTKTILSEDMYFAAKAVMKGYKVGYAPDAKVRHSHNYSVSEEFKRYFDIGVFHTEQSWIRENFGGAGGEGKKFIVSEFKYLIKKSPIYIVKAVLSNAAKLAGYKLGQSYKKLPMAIIRRLSMHSRYWL